MCKFFSCIATRDDRLLFTEEDSHNEVIQRAGLRDDRLIQRMFVRLEVLPPFERCEVDEWQTLPGWWDDVQHSMMDRARALAQRVNAVMEPFNQRDAEANAAYEAVWFPISTQIESEESALLTEERAGLDVVEARYKERIRAAAAARDHVISAAMRTHSGIEETGAIEIADRAWEAFQTAVNEALNEKFAERHEIRTQFMSQYEAINERAEKGRQMGQQAYDAIFTPAWDAMITSLQKIEGYVPK